MFLTTLGGGAPLAPEATRALTALGYGLVFVFSVRGAGMFALTTTTLLRSAGVMPRGVAVVAYLLAAWLLLTATDHPASLLVLPAWVLIVAVVLLRHDRGTRSTTTTPTSDTTAGPAGTSDPLPGAAPETTR